MRKLLAFGIVAVLLAGCGGGGSGSTTGTRGVSVFLTDNLSTDYAHVWVTVKKVSVSGTSGSHTLYENATGRTLDLTSLNVAGQQRFSFIGLGNVPIGNFDRISVTVSDQLTVFPIGSTTGQPRTFAGSAGGSKTIDIALPSGLGNDDKVVLDFDLSRWTEEGGIVTPVVSIHDESGLEDENRHEVEDYDGQVADVAGTAPNLTFSLRQGIFRVPVVTDASTRFFSSDGTALTGLVSGQSVTVYGTFDAVGQRLKAESVKVRRAGDDSGENEAKGSVSSISGDRFTISVETVDGFQPETLNVNVRTTEFTRYFSDSGLLMTSAEFFAALTTSETVELEGTYDEATNTFTALKVKFESEHHDGSGGDDSGDDHHESEFAGRITAFDATARTLSFRVSASEGTLLPVGTIVSVTVGEDTAFDLLGDDASAAAFFAGISNNAKIEAKGHLTGTTLEAIRLCLDD